MDFPFQMFINPSTRNFECVTRGISMLFSSILKLLKFLVCPWNSKYELLPTFSVRRLALNQSWTKLIHFPYSNVNNFGCGA